MESFAFLDYRFKSLWYIYSTSSKKKRKIPCLFASSKKPSKRKKLSNSFDKNRADVLAASDRGSDVEQEKFIALGPLDESMGERDR